MNTPADAVTLITRAFAFAAHRHGGQRRNAATEEPYLNHLTEVANLLAYATDGGDLVLVAAGVLHDTLEDTETTEDELRILFGPDIADLVREVTDPPDLGESERRQRQVEHTPTLSPRAKLLKIADKTSNIRERIAYRPDGISDERLRDYIEWGGMVVAGCRGLNQKLEDAFAEAFDTAMRKYGD
jgi:guanosine-3',5'-bis(diphosphate) 3'-pyrophosphohydrolase